MGEVEEEEVWLIRVPPFVGEHALFTKQGRGPADHTAEGCSTSGILSVLVMYYQGSRVPLNQGLKGDEEQKLAWVSWVWRHLAERLEMMIRLECWSDVEEEPCLPIFSLHLSLTQLFN